jgi:flagellar biosynthesis protein FlhG
MADSVSLHSRDDRQNKVSRLTPRKTSHVLAVTSGKSGVGKTSVALNLGIALAMKGARVCIFDADSKEANVNAQLGIIPGYAFEDYLEGGQTLDEVITEGPRGLHIIPAAAGLADLIGLDDGKRRMLTEAMKILERQYDYLLIDSGAGTDSTVLSLVQSASHTLLVISPEPASQSEACALVKALSVRNYPGTIYVLVNMVADMNNAMDVFRQFETAIKQQLRTEVQYFGYIALDEAVISSMHYRQPVLTQEPESPSSKCFLSLANKMNSLLHGTHNGQLFADYWEKIIAQSPDSQPDETENKTSTPAGRPQEQPTASLDYSRLKDVALEMLNSETATPEEATAFANSVLDAYIRKYNRFPGDLKETLYDVLERMDFPQNEMHDIIVTLETLFEKCSHQPVHDYQETIVKLFAEIHGSETKFRSISERLQASYERQFGQLLYDARKETIDSLLCEDRTGERLLGFIQEIKDAYRQRYNRKLSLQPPDIEDELLANVIRANQKEIDVLADEFTLFTRRLKELAIARQDLVDFLYNRPNTPDAKQDKD